MIAFLVVLSIALVFAEDRIAADDVLAPCSTHIEECMRRTRLCMTIAGGGRTSACLCYARESTKHETAYKCLYRVSMEYKWCSDAAFAKMEQFRKGTAFSNKDFAWDPDCQKWGCDGSKGSWIDIEFCSAATLQSVPKPLSGEEWWDAYMQGTTNQIARLRQLNKPAPADPPTMPKAPESFPETDDQPDPANPPSTTVNYNDAAFISKVCFNCEETSTGDYVSITGAYTDLLGLSLSYDVNGQLFTIATLTKEQLDSLEHEDKDCMTVTVAKKATAKTLKCVGQCNWSRTANRRFWVTSEDLGETLDVFVTNVESRTDDQVAQVRDAAFQPQGALTSETALASPMCSRDQSGSRLDGSSAASTVCTSTSVVALIGLSMAYGHNI